MAIIVINPNSTASMTDAMVRQARMSVPGLVFEGWTSEKGPPAIQGREDGDLATPALLELVERAATSGAQGIVIGCFDDTGLQDAARIARCPVIGIGQAAYHFAALRQWRFSVVTTLGVSVPILEENILELGLQRYLGRVRASEVPVLALEDDPDAAAQAVLDEARRAVAEDEIDSVVLGCAGMVQITETLRANLDVAVIDPVVCAAKSMMWLC